MTRRINSHERVLLDTLNEYNNRFYYESINKVIEKDNFIIKINKDKEEMVGFAIVTFEDGSSIDYQVKYNRIVNLDESYTLLV